MGLRKRIATSGRPEIADGARKEATLIKVVSKIEKYEIPNSLTLNIDQTPSKLTPTSRHILGEKNTKHVSIAGSSYKQAIITATFCITFSNEFLKHNKAFENSIFSNCVR